MTSPIVFPSLRTFCMVWDSITAASTTARVASPCRALKEAYSSGEREFHSGRHRQYNAGPNVSVSPYEWVTSNPKFFIRESIAGEGGAPPVRTWTVDGNGLILLGPAEARIPDTVGAPHKWVTLWLPIASNPLLAVTFRMHILVHVHDKVSVATPMPTPTSHIAVTV